MEDDDYRQVCIIEGLVISEDEIDDFISTLSEVFGCRFKFAEQFKTLPSMADGRPVEGTGGRNDVLFYVHKDDIVRFAVPRLRHGIRWIEDCFANMERRGDVYYPDRLRTYCTWDGTVSNEDYERKMSEMN